MPLFHFTDKALLPVSETTYEDEQLLERQDLQRLMRDRIDSIAPGCMVLAEEFCNWQDSRRRIDLLCLGRDARLVVVELKRTKSGEQMELQALRYAAMVSTMTFDQAVLAHEGYLRERGSDRDAEADILSFLDWESDADGEFGTGVQVILASADFSRELATTVLWLNGRGLDIRCIRIKPYRLRDEILIDVQTVIPLPEAEEYIVRLRERERESEQVKAQAARGDSIRKSFWEALLHRANKSGDLFSGISPTSQGWIGKGSGVSGLSFVYRITRMEAKVEFYIDTQDKLENERIFDALHARKEAIESAFGERLEWQRGDLKQSSQLVFTVPGGGYADEERWQELQDSMIDAMMRLERAIRPQLNFVGPGESDQTR